MMRIARNGTQYRGELKNCPAVIAVSKLLDFFSEISLPEAAAAAFA